MAQMVGYRSLFINDGKASNVSQNYKDVSWGTDGITSAFARKAGTARLLERNANLIKVLKDPAGALEEVQTEIFDMTKKRAERYQTLLYEFKNLGFSEEEATARADVMIGREMETDLALLQIKKPYAVGGAAAGGWDPVSGMLRGNPTAIKAGPAFAAIAQTGMGVRGGGGRIEKSEKLRLKKKWKRRRRAKRAAKAGLD